MKERETQCAQGQTAAKMSHRTAGPARALNGEVQGTVLIPFAGKHDVTLYPATERATQGRISGKIWRES